ncbi:hypothetical protein JG687_00018536 [Phytophthora cactorum]|uniref:Uncharacterized protein n=1 Tax=Phytophthora cactorum TaxID=29920 RepID=A0A8T1TQD2_9STRA|nr:hypothetical protein JG687_00018536 [Phytophthora cactorum]
MSTERTLHGLEQSGELEHEFLEDITASPQVVASEVAQLSRKATLSRTLTTPSGVVGRCIRSKFGEIVGKLARSKQLNDAEIDAALRHVATYSASCYAIDAVSVTDGKPFIPYFPLSNCKLFLVPVHMIALKHWMIQIVEIQMTTTESTNQKLWAMLCNPLGIESNLEICQAKWHSCTLPMLQRWFNRDVDRAKLLSLVPQNRPTHSTRSSSAAKNEGAHAQNPLPTFPSIHEVNMLRPTQVEA